MKVPGDRVMAMASKLFLVRQLEGRDRWFVVFFKL